MKASFRTVLIETLLCCLAGLAIGGALFHAWRAEMERPDVEAISSAFSP